MSAGRTLPEGGGLKNSGWRRRKLDRPTGGAGAGGRPRRGLRLETLLPTASPSCRVAGALYPLGMVVFAPSGAPHPASPVRSPENWRSVLGDPATSGADDQPRHRRSAHPAGAGAGHGLSPGASRAPTRRPSACSGPSRLHVLLPELPWVLAGMLLAHPRRPASIKAGRAVPGAERA